MLISKQRKELIKALNEVHDENKQLHQQLTESQASSKQKNAELDEIMEECRELELEIAQDNRRQATAREEAVQLKRQANDLKDELTAAEWKNEELEADEEKLRALIVSSPDRRRAEVEDRRERVLVEKKENVTIDNKIQQNKIAIRNLQKAERNLKTTTAKLEELHKAAHRAEEKILARRKQNALQLQAAQEALDTAKSRLLNVEKERREGMLRVQQGEAEVHSLHAAMEDDRVKTEKEIQEMVAEYKELERAFFERDRLRLAALGINA
jgi:chromosome segregation ATPase